MPMALVESRERKVPLVHEFREEMLIDTVRELAHAGDVPAIVFVFGREQCFEVARLLKSCRRFTTDEEKAQVEAMCDEALLPSRRGQGAPPAAHPRHRHPPRRHPAALQAARRAARARAADQVRGVDRDHRRRASTCRRAPWCSRRCASSSSRSRAWSPPPSTTRWRAAPAGRSSTTAGLAITLAPEQVVSDLKKELKDAAKRPGVRRGARSRSRVYGRARCRGPAQAATSSGRPRSTPSSCAASRPSCAARPRSPPSRSSRSACPT